MEEFMDKIELLKARRQQLLDSGKEIRKAISELVDEKSFVELDAYSFSHNDFYDEDATGEGVVTGYATIDETPVYLVAQNVSVLSGGISRANCAKIKKCLDKALQAGYPVVYLLDTLGVRVGEGVNVLEGIAEVVSASSDLKGQVPQFSVVLGKVYGSFALVCANCDYNFMLKESEVAYASPAVLAASTGKKTTGKDVAGVKTAEYNGMVSFEVGNVGEVKEKISEILSVLPEFSSAVADTADDLNRLSDNLNEKACPKCLIKAVFDDGKFIEIGKGFCPEVLTGIGRIGGISVGAIIFDGEEKGVELTAENIAKIKDFAYYTAENEIPLVTFVNALGIRADVATNNSLVLKETANLITALRLNTRVSVIYGKAVGLGYTLFSAKSGGVDYSFAFANAKVALFDGKVSAVAFGDVREDKLDELAAKYADENADPINAAKNGYIDDIIEPATVRPHLISALQMLTV